MKCQVAWNWKAARTELVVTSQKKERLVLHEAEWLSTVSSKRLIPVQFEYAHALDKRVAVRYDIMGLTKLSKCLRQHSLEESSWLHILKEIEEAIHVCTASSMLIDKMLFNPDFVYLDETMSPHLVYVPFSGMSFEENTNSPLALLAAMSDRRRVICQTAEGKRQLETLNKFVLNTKVFSINEYSRLLSKEFTSYDSASEQSMEQRVGDDSGNAEMSAGLGYLGELFSGDSSHGTDGGLCLRRESTGQAYPLVEGAEVVVGSSRECGVVITNNRFMSSRHLSLRVMKDDVMLVDLGSSYGTFAFNRRLDPLSPVQLSVNDCFLVGGEKFYIVACEETYVAR